MADVITQLSKEAHEGRRIHWESFYRLQVNKTGVITTGMSRVKVSLRKPSPRSILRFLQQQEGRSYSYGAVGATSTTPPAGFVVDHTRVRLGEGEPVFRVAMHALRRWEQFRLGWVDVGSPEVPIQPGQVQAVMGYACGIWWLNACQIVYVVDDTRSTPVSRFGFAYGTLPDHIESGEERFLVEWDRESNSVWYDILAFSRPNYFLAKLAQPLVRCKQKQFARDSANAMHRAVRNPSQV